MIWSNSSSNLRDLAAKWVRKISNWTRHFGMLGDRGWWFGLNRHPGKIPHEIELGWPLLSLKSRRRCLEQDPSNANPLFTKLIYLKWPIGISTIYFGHKRRILYYKMRRLLNENYLEEMLPRKPGHFCEAASTWRYRKLFSWCEICSTLFVNRIGNELWMYSDIF